MMYATKIRMQNGCERSHHCADIAEIYLEGSGANHFYKKEDLHDYLRKNPQAIRVKLGIQPYVIPAMLWSTKYVRSEPNDTPRDNLLSLPRV